MLKVRVVATMCATLLAMGLTACGSHQSAGTQADGTTQGGASGGASSSLTPASGQSPGDAASKASPGNASSPSAGGKPSKGNYDDISGTTSKGPKNQAAVLTQLPGKATGRCVSVGSRTDVRSGSMAMGNFVLARKNFRQAKSAYDAEASFFYVIPRSRASESVTVVATRLGGRATPVRVHSDQVEQAAQWNYFPVQVQIPASGTWRFRVTIGTQHGCFDASFAT